MIMSKSAALQMTRFPWSSLICVFALAACDSNSSLEPLVDTGTPISWPGESWQTWAPEQEVLNGQAIVQLDEEFRAGKHGYVDSMLIIRNGHLTFEAYYENNYRTINEELGLLMLCRLQEPGQGLEMHRNLITRI